MDRTERFYKMMALLKANRAVPRARFLEELEVSLATFKRDLRYLIDRVHAPIVWDSKLGGYRMNDKDPKAASFELPGMWFNASEAHALLAMQALLNGMQPGLLTPHVKPLQDRIEGLIEKGDHTLKEVRRRIRVLAQGAHAVPDGHFGAVSYAVLSRKRLRITHYNRERNDTTEREISPQRLVHYRDNWYIDAWCHLRDGLRCFSLSSISRAEPLETAAKSVSDDVLDEELASSYGIFTGKADKVAKLKFTPARARWVAGEVWHPMQKGTQQSDGSFVLEIPYRDDRELIMDILKHGPEVEVLAPRGLRARIDALCAAMQKRYRS
jgi:predicted DNA-binding transcriptional regulator YafY